MDLRSEKKNKKKRKKEKKRRSKIIMMRRFINYIIYRNSIAFSFFQKLLFILLPSLFLLFITAVVFGFVVLSLLKNLSIQRP